MEAAKSKDTVKGLKTVWNPVSNDPPIGGTRLVTR